MVIVPRSAVVVPSAHDVTPAVRPHVVVVDGQTLFMEALAGLLARPPLSAATSMVSRSDEAIELLYQEPAHLILCDLKPHPLPLRSFLGLLAELPSPPAVMILGDVGEEYLLVEEMGTDAAGLFTKDTNPEQFLEGVRMVLAGHRAVGDNVMRSLIARLHGSDLSTARTGVSQLSPTELDILTMVGSARTVQQIAVARGISPKTVRNHLANIYRKLELRSRTEAMLCAARLGLTAAAE